MVLAAMIDAAVPCRISERERNCRRSSPAARALQIDGGWTYGEGARGERLAWARARWLRLC